MLSLLLFFLNIWDQLCSSNIWYEHLLTASTTWSSAPAATASTAASRRAFTLSRLLGHNVVPLLIVG